MTKLLKPMLAGKFEEELARFPMSASPKIDGVRCLINGGVAWSRSLKPIPNKWLQGQIAAIQQGFAKKGVQGIEGFDGELIVGKPTDPDVYRNTNSFVMSHDKEDADITLFAFDHMGISGHFSQRFNGLNYDTYHHGSKLPNGPYGTIIHDREEGQTNLKIIQLEHRWIEDMAQLNAYEKECLDLGYEGVMVRDPQGAYKNGRSSSREGLLLKVKRFEDAEARVVGFVERQHNGNEAFTNELGRTARSSAKAGKVGNDSLGALVVEGIEAFPNIQFELGTGYTEEERQELWAQRHELVGSMVRYKYFAGGVKDLPRFPVFQGFRYDL